MFVYRIVFKKFSQSLVAPGLEGRWNSAGRKVIYTAESIPLAFLENMIRRKGVGFNQNFRTMIIDVPDNLAIEAIEKDRLAGGWRDARNYQICQVLGDAWLDRAATVGLKVPSAVLPDNANYVFNPAHPDFARIAVATVTDLVPDERIEEILKKYAGGK